MANKPEQANFTPNQDEYSNLTPFKAWIVKNFNFITNYPYLDDSYDALTNYEFLCQVVKTLKTTVENQENTQNNVIALLEAFTKLQDYINVWFNDLDVQEEINNKLDDLVKDGTLTHLISAYLDPLVDAQDEKIDNMQHKIDAAANGSPYGVFNTLNDLNNAATDKNRIYVVLETGNWYYYNGSSWVSGGKYQTAQALTDMTLSKYNESPDSKTVGLTLNNITELKHYYNLLDVNKIEEKSYFIDNFEKVTSKNDIITDYIPGKPGDCFISTALNTSNNKRKTTDNTKVAYFDINKNFISYEQFNYNYSTGKMVELPENAYYFRLSFSIAGGTRGDVLANQAMIIYVTKETAASENELPYIYYQYNGDIKKKDLSLEVQDSLNAIDGLKANLEPEKDFYNLYNKNASMKDFRDTIYNVPSPSTNQYLSNLIKIDSNKKYLITRKNTSNSWGRSTLAINYVYFFDTNMNFISHILKFEPFINDNPTLLEPPANAKYVRFSTAWETKEKYDNAEIMFFETTDETCKVDERFNYVDYQPITYFITEKTLAREIKDTINTFMQDKYLLNLGRIKNTFRYIVSSFIGTSKDGMVLLGTNDLKRFDLISKKGVYTAKNSNTGSVRDPAMIKIGEYFYIVYTTIGFDKGDLIGFCRTKDFKTYEELPNLQVTNTDNNTFEQIWAPAWFRDIDGTLYILSAGSLTPNHFSMVINKYNPNTHTLDAGHITNIAAIDGHVYYENGMYYMAVGGAHIYKSKSIMGTWSLITDNNLNATGYEADFIMKLDNGKWRLFMQQLQSTFGTAHMVYTDADSLDGKWGKIQEVTYTDEALKYARDNGRKNDEYWHWTIYDFENHNNNNNYFIS